MTSEYQATRQDDLQTGVQPWWRFGHVWLVISGPVVVVVAGFVTLYLAISSPNEIVRDPNEAQYTRGSSMVQSGQAPAMQARNHAQTPVVPVAK